MVSRNIIVMVTFRFLQDLQFIDSRGSAWTRRGVRRSMLTWGRDMALPVHRRDGEDGVGVVGVAGVVGGCGCGKRIEDEVQRE